MRSFNALPIVASVFALAFAQFCLAQSFTSSITGTVTDPTGAAVQGATLELKDMATNDVRNATSESNGAYQFTNLSPGTYQITATAAGFKSFAQQNLVLQANIAAHVNISLELGNTQQKVEVTGSAVLVDTETANNSVTLNSQLINALPNSTRSPLNFVFAVAGTTEAPGGQTQKSGSLDQMASNFGLNGGRTGDESILIDGAPSQAIDWGGLMVSPLQDSVQEQQIIESTYDAQYERGGAGIVTLITKGGSNSFHGEAYDYLQNSALNANSWFNNKTATAKGQFKQNQFGGNFSGPLLKRANLFFFGGYEGLRQPNTQSTGLITVPTAAERAGNFAGVVNADGTPDLIYNPFTTTATTANATGFTRAPFRGNVIPANLINPVGLAMVNLYPLPNRPGLGVAQTDNYFAQGSGNTMNDKMDTRVDWEQSSVHRLFVRWSDRFRQSQSLPCFFCNGADTGFDQANNGFQVVLNDTVTPSPTWVINSYVSYSRWKEQHTGQGFGQGNASEIGLSPSLFQSPLLPSISVDGPYTGLGNTAFQQYVRYSNTIQSNITKVFSKHTLKFGGNFDDQRINSINQAGGSFNFSAAQTSCDPDASGVCAAQNTFTGASGNAIASMLLGTGSGGGTGINIDPAMGVHIFGAYIQDQWRVSQRLTVNAGVRYENQRPATERINRIDYFNPGALNPISPLVEPLLGHPLSGQIEYAGVNGNDRYAWPPDNLNFAPRAGLAYKVSDKLVARIGAGIFFLPASAMLTFDNPAQFEGFSSFTPYLATTNNGFTPLTLVSNPFPQGIAQPTGSALGGFTLLGNGESQVWPKASHPTPYTEQWSFDLQYQLSNHSVFEIGYNGNRGRKLLYGNPNINADQLPDQFLNLGSATLDALVPNPFYGIIDPNSSLGSQGPTPGGPPQCQQRGCIPYNQLLRPFPQYTYLTWTRSLPGARSSFNALNVKYNQNFTAGLSLLVTYQWSKALDNGPEDNFGWATGNQWRDSYNTMLDYNISTHDVPQSFATALVYDLPYGRGKKWGNTAPGIVKEVLGNWQLSSVVRLASGLPIPTMVNYGYGNPLGDLYGFPVGDAVIPDLVGNPAASTFQVGPGNTVPAPGASVTVTRGPDSWINPNAFAAPVYTAINGNPNDLIYRNGNAPARDTRLRERAARNVDLSIAKNFGGERYQAWLRGEFINSFNYAQYNNFCTDVTLESGCVPFGAAQGTENQPRIIQLSLKLMF